MANLGHAGYEGLDPVPDCPICGSASVIRMYTDCDIYVCPDCEAHFAQDEETGEVIDFGDGGAGSVQNSTRAVSRSHGATSLGPILGAISETTDDAIIW